MCKRCPRCNVDKPLDEFHRGSARADGRQTYCKACVSEKQKENRKAENERGRRYSLSEHGKARRRKYVVENRDAINKAHRRWKSKPEEKAKSRERWLTYRYGITESEFAAMLNTQGHVCGICAEPAPAGKRLHVDHDHATGAVRGLLCGPCNRAIGLFKESRTLLFKAVEYIDAHAFTGTT